LLWDGLTLVSWQWMLGFNALFQLGLVIASGDDHFWGNRLPFIAGC
jgi:hypothetical protein